MTPRAKKPAAAEAPVVLRVTAKRVELLECLDRVLPALDRVTLTVAGEHVLLRPDGDYLTIEGSGVQRYARSCVHCRVEGTAAIALHASALAARLRQLDAEEVELVVADKVTLRAGKTRFGLPLFPVDNMTPLPVVGGDLGSVTLDGAWLRTELLRAATFAAGDETRANIHGVHIRWTSEKVTAVATDGHRVGVFERPGPTESKGLSALFVDSDSVKILAEALHDGPVTLRATPTWIIFGEEVPIEIGVKRVAYGSGMAEDACPPYTQVIPANSTNRCVVRREEMLRALGAAGLLAILAILETSAEGLAIDASADRIIKEEKAPKHAQGDVSICVGCEGTVERMGHRTQYLRDALVALDGHERILLESSGELDPLVVRPLEGIDALVCTMPMRLP